MGAWEPDNRGKTTDFQMLVKLNRLLTVSQQKVYRIPLAAGASMMNEALVYHPDYAKKGVACHYKRIGFRAEVSAQAFGFCNLKPDFPGSHP